MAWASLLRPADYQLEPITISWSLASLLTTNGSVSPSRLQSKRTDISYKRLHDDTRLYSNKLVLCSWEYKAGSAPSFLSPAPTPTHKKCRCQPHQPHLILCHQLNLTARQRLGKKQLRALKSTQNCNGTFFLYFLSLLYGTTSNNTHTQAHAHR